MKMKSIFLFAFLCAFAVLSASATWTVTSGLNADGTTTDNFYATDGTWDLKFSRSGNGGYYCRNNSGTGGALLDLTTFNDDMASPIRKPSLALSRSVECWVNTSPDPLGPGMFAIRFIA